MTPKWLKILIGLLIGAVVGAVVAVVLTLALIFAPTLWMRINWDHAIGIFVFPILAAPIGAIVGAVVGVVCALKPHKIE